MTNVQSLGYFDGVSDGVVLAVDEMKKILLTSNHNTDKDTCLYIENCLKELEELRNKYEREVK